MNESKLQLGTSILLSSEDKTSLLARQIADSSPAGTTILLYGEIGAGKTFFARKYIQKLLSKYGIIEDIPSPTYTLVQTYQTPETEIWHADLYRLNSTDDLTELGLSEAFGNEICIVEWPEKLKNYLPLNAIYINFKYHSDTSRICNIMCHDEKIMIDLKLIIKKFKNEP